MIRKHTSDGVFYFADDDNMYDLELFDQMRYIKKGCILICWINTKIWFKHPNFMNNGTFSGQYETWIGRQKYVFFLFSRPKLSLIQSLMNIAVHKNLREIKNEVF